MLWLMCSSYSRQVLNAANHRNRYFTAPHGLLNRTSAPERRVVEGVFADEALACWLLCQQKQSRADGAHQAYCGHRLGKEQLACRRIHGHVFDATLGFAFDLPHQIEMRDPAEISLDVADEQVVLG